MRTQDERLLLALYEQEKREGDSLDVYKIAASMGLSWRGARTISRLLLQANFLKKGENNCVTLTDRGRSLAQKLFHE